MNESKQGRYALLVIFVSFLLVIGSLITAFAETSFSIGQNQATPPTQEVTDIVFITITNTLAPTPLPSETPAASTPTPTVDTPTLTPTSDTPPTLSQCDPPEGWDVLFIEPDQSLEEIAAGYQTTTDILIQGNCLSSTELLPGYIIFVPPLSPTATTAATNTATGCTHPAGWITYTVQSGDNLFKISKAFSTTVAELQAANCMGSSTTIISGTKLWVPNVATITPTPTKTATKTNKPRPTKTPIPSNTHTPTATPEPPPNIAPVAVDDGDSSYTVNGSGNLTVDAPGVLANDSDADSGPAPLTAIWKTGPECASSEVILNDDGSFTYTYDESKGVCTGPDTFTYVAFDGEDESDPATVTITFP